MTSSSSASNTSTFTKLMLGVAGLVLILAFSILLFQPRVRLMNALLRAPLRKEFSNVKLSATCDGDLIEIQTDDEGYFYQPPCREFDLPGFGQSTNLVSPGNPRREVSIDVFDKALPVTVKYLNADGKEVKTGIPGSFKQPFLPTGDGSKSAVSFLTRDADLQVTFPVLDEWRIVKQTTSKTAHGVEITCTVKQVPVSSRKRRP